MKASEKAAKKKEEQLGMPLGTAMARLKKQIMFSLMKKCGEDKCFHCKKPITCVQDMTVEHKKNWLDSDPKLFWDLRNIAFSHMHCNYRAARRNRRWSTSSDKWRGQYLYRRLDPKRYQRILTMKRRRYHSTYSTKAVRKLRTPL